MSPNGTPRHRANPRGWEWLRDLFERAKVWAAMVGSLVLGGLLIARFAGIAGPLTGPLPLVTLATALAVICAQLLLDVKKTVDQLGSAVRADIRRAEASFDLQDAAQDLTRDLHDLQPTHIVRIDHLGLDMMHAWGRVVDWFQLPVRVGVDVRLLMLVGRQDLIPGEVPAEVAMWCQNVSHSLTRIRQWLSEEGSALRAGGRSIRIRVKQYAEVPAIHGFRVTEPFSVTYLAFCRWEGPSWDRYNWGERNYHRIADANRSWSQNDLAELFHAKFEHLWTVSGDSVIDWPGPDPEPERSPPRAP